MSFSIGNPRAGGPPLTIRMPLHPEVVPPTGRRTRQVIRGEDPKGFKLLRFTSAVTSLTAEARGKFLLAGAPKTPRE